MNTRPIYKIMRPLALLLPVIAILFVAQLGYASPAHDNGKGATGDKVSASPTPTPYLLYGDKVNQDGQHSTRFRTFNDDGDGAWWFASLDKHGMGLRVTCGGNGDCQGISAEADSIGISANAFNPNGGKDFNNVSYGVEGVTYGSGPYAVGVYGRGDYNMFKTQIGVLGETFGADGIGVSGVSDGTGIYAETKYGDGYALYALASASYAIGSIYGESKNGTAITGQAFGKTSDNKPVSGVNGNLAMNAAADPATHSGVYGACLLCSGVTGQSDSYIGVRGLVTGTATTAYGGYFSATMGIGLYGQSSAKYGVYGKSNSSYAVLGISNSGYGVYGKGINGIGVYAKTDNGNIALRAVQPNSGADKYAGYFDGNVQVNGNLTCSGGCVAALAVNTDKGERLVYADASTQSYLSDQGSATLKNGHAVIKIDPLFAQTVALGSGYQVFVTPHSADTTGLAVINDGPGSFEVVELARGKGSFKFDWRITALRKGYETVRLAPGPTKMPAPSDVK